MKILSIETSCDDTCITIMEMRGSFSARGGFALGGKILANNSNSQIKSHIPYGGVFPAVAKREHLKNLPILLQKSLKDARLEKKKKPVDAIAVTYGPGLEPCLWTGIVLAQELAEKWKVPVVPVNHMEGHVLSVFGKAKGKFKIPKVEFPVLALLVSGGHTELVLMKNWGKYEIIGETVDDAVGEAFDKVARMLGLPYPGGPQISKLAEKARSSRERSLGRSDGDGQRKFSPENFRAESAGASGFVFPRPMLKSKDLNFSYSGLKTAVLYLIRDLTKKHSNILQNVRIKSEIALEFENAAIETLVYKTNKAIEKYKVKTLIVAGGVAANKYLRTEMKKLTGKKVKLLFPTPELSTDNSIMIGIAGYLKYLKNKKKTPKPNTIKATGNLRL